MEQILEFAANHPLLVGAAVLTGGLLLFNEWRLMGTARYTISTDQAVRLMNKGALVLDFRPPEAFATGHLSGARNLAVKNLESELATLERYKKKPVITYDERGMGVSRAVAALRRNQFEFVFLLRGGINAWREEHLPVEKQNG